MQVELEDEAARSIRRRELKLVAPLGTGRRCTVWKAQRGAEVVAVELFTKRAIEKHASRHQEPLARFEFNRNRRSILGLLPNDSVRDHTEVRQNGFDPPQEP